MKGKSILMLIPVFIIYIIIFRFIYLEDGLSLIFTISIPILTGLLLALILNPILIFLQIKLNIENRYIAILLTYLIVFGIIIMIIIITLPELTESIKQLLVDVPKLFYAANEFLLNLNNNYKILHINNSLYLILQNYLQNLAHNLSSILNIFLNFAFDKVINIVAAIGNFLLALIISIYILKDKEKIKIWFYKLCLVLFEKKYANEILYFAYDLNKKLSSYIVGKLIDSSIIGILTYLGSKYIIKAPYPLIDGLIIGVTNIIPYFGTLIGSVPVSLINLLYDPNKGFLIFILILILEQIDGLIISPKVLSSQLSVNPIIIIVSIIIGGGLFGPIGLFFATPVAALFKTSIDVYIKLKLKDKNIQLPNKNL